MLGNWSLGDYFKKEQLPWIFEFLTKELGLDPKETYMFLYLKAQKTYHVMKNLLAYGKVSVYRKRRIVSYGVKKNWWSRSGEPNQMPIGEPGGPDSEVFYDFGPTTASGQEFHTPQFGPRCHPNCECGRFMEIGNSVFMQYQKQADGTLRELAQKSVDFGGGLERMVAATKILLIFLNGFISRIH